MKLGPTALAWALFREEQRLKLQFLEGTGCKQCYFNAQVSACVTAQREERFAYFCISTRAISTSWTPGSAASFSDAQRSAGKATLKHNSRQMACTLEHSSVPLRLCGASIKALHRPAGYPGQKVSRWQLNIISPAMLSPSCGV